MDFAALLFGGETFAKVLEALMERPGEVLTPSQIVRKTGLTSKDSLYRALGRGQQIGLIRRDSLGAAGAYRINTDSSLYPEVKLLVDKLTGFFQALTGALLQLPGREVGFVFGSAAIGRVRADSDVDVFLMGSLSTLDAAKAVAPVAEKYGRQVNVVTYSREEVEDRLRAGDPWTAQVWEGHKLFLFGEESDLPDMRVGATKATWSP